MIVGRGRSGIGGGDSISSDTSCSIASGWAAISSTDTISSDIRGLLRLNSEDSAKDDNGNILTRTYSTSYSGGRSVMVEEI